MDKIKTIILTGASGFVGRYFIDKFKSDYNIYALARRPQKAVHIDRHPNVHWRRVDLANREDVEKIFKNIAKNDKVDYIIHLAAYFRFDGKDHPEYWRTNVRGTENVLLTAEKVKPELFVFMSSISVTDFKKSNTVITEKSPADGQIPYARSKREGEYLVRRFANHMRCVILRPSVIYSDWCEYLPLYCFLMNWGKNRWNYRIIPGREGVSGFPLLHIKDLLAFFRVLLEHGEFDSSPEVFLISPAEHASQRLLLKTLSTFSYFESIEPIHLPVWVAYLGITLIRFISIFLRRKPFEQPWLLKYVDKEMQVNSEYTKKTLNWQPKSRYRIERRLLFLIDKMRNYPLEWRYRNEVFPFHAIIERPFIKIYESLMDQKREIVAMIVKTLTSSVNGQVLKGYRNLTIKELTRRVEYIYTMLEEDLRTGEHTNVLRYAEHLGQERKREGFPFEEVKEAIHLTAEIIMEKLLAIPELESLKQKIHDEIMLAFRMIVDKIQDVYEESVREHEK